MIRRLLPILLLLLCCPSIYAQSKQLLPDNGKRHASNGLTIRESNAKHLRLTANVGAISLNDTTTKKGDFIELQTEGAYITGAEGEPQLPAFRKLVQMPSGAKPIVTIKHADTTFYNLSDIGIDRRITPRQPSQSKSGKEQKMKYRKRSYRRNYFTQNELVSITPVGTMRGIGIGQVAVNPVRYNPKQNTLMVLSNIEFDVDFEGGLAKSGAKGDSPYFDGVYSALDNYKSGNPNLTKYPVKYLIITDTAFVKSLSDFIKWKRQKGFNVVVATTDIIGKTAADIKAWVSAQYADTADSPAPSFLLLAADTDKIPTVKAGSLFSYGTDLYYACMDGDDDFIPDMYYGRFSARTAEQMKAIADKTITYEKYLFDDPSYLSKATLIAGSDGTYNPAVGIPTVNYITNNRINAKNGYSKVKKYTTSYSGCYADSSVAVGLMTYTAHGETTGWVDPYLSQNKVRGFGYQGQFPFVIANCCLSGQFTQDECIGETWLRKENGGAVAYIGSSPKTYWHEDFYWAVGAHKYKPRVSPDTSATTIGAFDMPFLFDFVCGGALMFTGNMAVTEAIDSSRVNNDYTTNVSSRYYWEGYNYLGDPSLLVYFGEAKDNIVSHNVTIPVANNMVHVSALAGSYVALSVDGELLGAAYVPKGESGVNVPIKPVSQPCEIDIVVTKPRYKPYIGKTTAILPDQSYLVISDNPFKYRSLQSGGIAGFDVVVKNLGQQASQAATVSITSTSPLVKNISTTQTTIPPIGSQANQTFTNMCRIELADNIADGVKIPFKFTVTENEQTTVNEFTLNVTAPKLKLLATLTIDKPNGQISPGETADIVIPITNTGHERVDLASANLVPDHEQPDVRVVSGEQTISNLNPGDTALCRFTIASDEYADMMTIFDFKITATTGQPLHSDSHQYSLTIGKLDDKIIGTGTSTTNLYPFNNWYKTGRTQILYTAADLGNLPIKIGEIAFQFKNITPKNEFDGFNNFTIKMKYYKPDNLKGLEYFIDMSDAETVLKKDLLEIESKELNLKLDKPFIYNGKDNVLLEIGWGMNTTFVEKDSRPDIYGHYTNDITVASEFVDDAESPDEITKVYRRSDYRPNTIFRYQKPKYVLFDVKDTDGEPLADVEIAIDDNTTTTDENGKAQLLAFTNRKIEYSLSLDYAVNEEVINASNDTVHISLLLQRLNVYTVTFHVVDSATRASLQNARLAIGRLKATTNESGLVTFDKIPNLQLDCIVEADGYFSATKPFAINSDTLISVAIAKKPWIEFNIHNGSTPQANFGVTVANSLITTDNTGLATFIPQQFDTIPYSIAINSSISIADTIYNLQKPTIIDIDMALIDTTSNYLQIGDTNYNPQQQSHTIIFCLSDGSSPIDSVRITMNGIEKNTDSTGCAVFDGLASGTEIAYIISKIGYETTDGLESLRDTIVCSGNSIIKVMLRKQLNTSLSTDNQSDIKIYPNPSNGVFFIDNCNDAKISVFNSNGNYLKTTKINNGKFDIRPIAPGLYTLIAETQKGIVTVQIVIY